MAEERTRKLIKYLWVNRQGESYQRESYKLQQGEALPILNDLRQQEMRYSVARRKCSPTVQEGFIFILVPCRRTESAHLKRSHDFATGLAPIALIKSKILLPPFLFST